MSLASETAPAAEVRALLQATVARYVDPAARVVAARALPIRAGMSGATVRRYELRMTGPPRAPASVRLVVKEASLTERRTLAHLGAQALAGVPFSHTLDPGADRAALVCMQDVGSVPRPSSRDPIAEVTLDREAAALAGIHAANRGRTDLDWLPRADRAYYARMIWSEFWRPHWEQAVADPGFRARYAADLDRVETAATGIVDAMAALSDEADTLTLAHTDINPSNILLLDGAPYIIDWQSAHYGPFYLDAPHHFFTPALAERYRRALAAHGIAVARSHFAERFRVAARYTALRYMWWTFEAWRDDPREEAWVRHYFRMI